MIQTSFQKSIVFFGMEGFYAGIQENPAIFSSISPVFSSVCVCFLTIKIPKKPSDVFRVFPGVGGFLGTRLTFGLRRCDLVPPSIPSLMPCWPPPASEFEPTVDVKSM